MKGNNKKGFYTIEFLRISDPSTFDVVIRRHGPDDGCFVKRFPELEGMVKEKSKAFADLKIIEALDQATVGWMEKQMDNIKMPAKPINGERVSSEPQKQKGI